MTGFERPAPDVDKIVSAWRTWSANDGEILPGRTMADLKTAGADRMLADLAGDNDVVAPIADAWTAWERGRVGPGDTLSALESSGFADIVEALAEPT